MLGTDIRCMVTTDGVTPSCKHRSGLLSGTEQGRRGEEKIITGSSNNKPNANSYARWAYGLFSSNPFLFVVFAISKSFEKRYLESNER